MFEEGLDPEDAPECEHGLPGTRRCGFCLRGLVAVVVSGDDIISEL